jgi:ketosteroid isomerase-like protein
MNELQAELWNLVRESNRAWMSGSTHELSELFDEHAVIIAPALRGRVEGREAIVASYTSYNMHAKTHSFEEMEHHVDVFGDTAVITYRFQVRYELIADGVQHDETGQEVLVMRKTDRWRVLWRTQIEVEEV